MEFSRRTMLAGAGIAATLTASPSEACTVLGRLKSVGFSDAACRRSLRGLVELINDAPTLSDAEVQARSNELSIRFDASMSDPILNYPNTRPIEDMDLIRGWSVSAAQQDRSPLLMTEVNLLKVGKGIALYQFTFRRDQFHQGVSEEDAGGSCEGAFNAFYGSEDVSYLGLFKNNRLREVWAFDAWLSEL